MSNPSGVLRLKQGRDKPVRQRHPWIFSGAIAAVDGSPEPGDLVTVLAAGGAQLGTAYFNPHSQIRARMLAWGEATVDAEFWRQRLTRALDYRRALALEPETNAYRLVNAEADGLPGLIVDRYADVLVVQCLTLGIDRRRDELVTHLVELTRPQAVVERSDADVRRKEGLKRRRGVVWGDLAGASTYDAGSGALTIHENGLHFEVDPVGGHKTGTYLDQRENRAELGRTVHVAGKRVLNLFSYTGGFGVYAAQGGADRVVNVDSSAAVLEAATANFRRNGLDPEAHEFIAADAFEQLRRYRDAGEQFDAIILDPPKFAHSRRDVRRASRGYKDINWLALRLLRPGGLLATFSCSGQISADLFQKIVFGAAIDAERDVQIMRPLAQAPDHPVLLTFPESAYLKGLLCRVW